MCMTFSILSKCTIILLIRRASASRAHSPGADVTKFKSVQNTNFGGGQPAFGRNHKGHSECKINLDQVALVLNKATRQFLFLSRLCVAVTISVACHVVAGDSNLKYKFTMHKYSSPVKQLFHLIFSA